MLTSPLFSRGWLLLSAIAACYFQSVPARADLTGERIDASGHLWSPSSATVGDGVEFLLGEDLTFDLSASTLTVRRTRDYHFAWGSWAEKYVLSGFDSRIRSVTIAENRGFTGAIVENFDFTADSIIFDFGPLSRTGDILVFHIQTASEPPDDISVPLLEVGEAVELRWQSKPGFLYQVWHSSDTIFWVTDGSTMAGTGAELSELRVWDSIRQHYRVTERPSLLGESLSASGSQVTPSLATVGAGEEFFLTPNGSLSFDFDKDTLTIRVKPGELTGGWSSMGRYAFSGFDATILHVALAENQGFRGSVIENVSFTPHSIAFDFGPWSGAGTSVVFHIQTAARVVEQVETRPAIELRWRSQEGVNYQIQQSSDLRSWIDDGASHAGTGGTLSVMRPMDSEQHYYRVAIP